MHTVLCIATHCLCNGVLGYIIYSCINLQIHVVAVVYDRHYREFDANFMIYILLAFVDCRAFSYIFKSHIERCS